MNAWRAILSLFVLVVSAWLQLGLAPRIAFLGAEPDFLLCALACLGMFANRGGGALIGFGAGVFYGAPAMANLWAYGFTRTLTGFCVGWFNSLELKPTVGVAMATAFLTTLLARCLLLLLAPPPLITPFLKATIISGAYNGVLAIPLYAFLQKSMGPDRR